MCIAKIRRADTKVNSSGLRLRRLCCLDHRAMKCAAVIMLCQLQASVVDAHVHNPPHTQIPPHTNLHIHNPHVYIPSCTQHFTYTTLHEHNFQHTWCYLLWQVKAAPSGWGFGSPHKWLLWACDDLSLDPGTPVRIQWCSLCLLSQFWRSGGRGIPGACWPASLTEFMSLRSVKDSVSNNTLENHW